MNAAGAKQPVRYRLLPEAGTGYLDATGAAAQGPNFLMEELAARLAEFELRIADRISALERRMDDHFRAQTRMLIGLYASVAIAAIVFAVKG